MVTTIRQNLTDNNKKRKEYAAAVLQEHALTEKLVNDTTRFIRATGKKDTGASAVLLTTGKRVVFVTSMPIGAIMEKGQMYAALLTDAIDAGMEQVIRQSGMTLPEAPQEPLAVQTEAQLPGQFKPQPKAEPVRDPAVSAMEKGQEYAAQLAGKAEPVKDPAVSAPEPAEDAPETPEAAEAAAEPEEAPAEPQSEEAPAETPDSDAVEPAAPKE